MKTITMHKEIEFFEFKELDEEVQEKIKDEFLETKEPCEFTELVEEQLKFLLPNSKLKFQYDLSYCYGNGLNIYGKIKIGDFLNAYELLSSFKNSPFNDKEISLIHGFKDIVDTLELIMNNRYTYSIIDRNEFANEILEEFEWSNIPVSNELKEVIIKLDSELKEMLNFINDGYYKAGESYFYVVHDWEIATHEFFQGYFTKDGKRNISIYDIII